MWELHRRALILTTDFHTPQQENYPRLVPQQIVWRRQAAVACGPTTLAQARCRAQRHLNCTSKGSRRRRAPAPKLSWMTVLWTEMIGVVWLAHRACRAWEKYRGPPCNLPTDSQRCPGHLEYLFHARATALVKQGRTALALVPRGMTRQASCAATVSMGGTRKIHLHPASHAPTAPWSLCKRF